MTILRIAIADDHPVVLEQISARLAQESTLEICNAGTAEKVLAWLEDECPEALLIDPQSQKGVNLELIAEIRRRFPELRVIVFTAIVDTVTHIELRRLGVVDVLEKGIDTQNLLQVLLLKSG